MLMPGEKLQKLLTLLITWALLLAFFFAYERYFVEGQKDFLRERGFRVLAALSNELNSKFDQARYSTESSLKLVASPNSQKQETPDQSQADCELPVVEPPSKSAKNTQIQLLCRYLNLYLEGAWIGDKSWKEATNCWGTDPDHIPLETIADNHGLILSIHCFTKPNPKAPTSPDLTTKTRIYKLDLSPWVRSAFHALGGYFDDVWVADSTTGQVVFQQSITGPRISNLKHIIPNTDNAQSKQSSNSSSKESKPQEKSEKEEPGQAGPPSDQKPNAQEASGFQRLNEASAFTKIVLAGESYKLFSQPDRIVLGNYPPGGKTWNLVVCGLRRTNSFDSESHAVPYSTLIWAALIVVALFSLSWPLFKLRYMNNTERFSFRDGWYLILAIFLASTSAMLTLLNASYASHAQDVADSQMRQLAAKIKHNVKDEVSQAFQQLMRIRKDSKFSTYGKDPQSPPLIPNYLDQKKDLCYPYLEIVFWANRDGDQLLKFDVRPATTPATNVHAFSFFKDSISDLKWLREGGSDRSEQDKPDSTKQEASCQTPPRELLPTDHVHLEPQFSPNTGEFLVVLSAPFTGDGETDEEKKIALQALATKPLSLVQPVLPPGYGFAVIDARCKVLFHSDAIRNMRENFCQESKSNDELKPWLFSGVDTPLDISYAGRPERAYVTALPLPGLSAGQAFLIVFREPDLQLTLNLAIILVCSVLMGVYFATLLLAAVMHLSLRGPLHLIYSPQLVWPRPENALSYVQLLAANGLMLLLFWLSYRWLYEAPLLALTLAVALLSLLFVVLKLRFSPQVLFRLGRRLTCVALCALLALFARWALSALLRLLQPSSEPLGEWMILSTLLGIFGLIAVLLSGESSWITRLTDRGLTVREWVRKFAHKRFSLAYALAAVSVITGVALVPCVGFFKYAYDAVSELSLKHDQLVLSERLLARRNRIRQYYETVRAPETAEKRICATWDRYDSDFFTVNGEPALVDDPQTSCPAARELSNRASRQNEPGFASPKQTINNWIEKQIARATLKFPANQLGSEISKLGVASTGGDGNNPWEHSWSELNPRRFSLYWQSDSRLPNFSVISSYPAWEGLRWWAHVCLLLLWVLLILWLMSLVKKIFFTDVQSTPAFQTVDWKAVEDIKTNSLVIGSAQSGKTGQLRAVAGLSEGDCRDLRVELKEMIGDRYYRKPCCQGSVLVLDHFEFNIKDRDYNLARLNLLESLLYDSACKLVLVSTVDPLYFLTEGAPEMLSISKDPEDARRLLDRWARALSKFIKVHLTDTGREEFEKKVSKFAEADTKFADFAIWVREECRCTAFLRRIGTEILDQFQAKEAGTREWLVRSVLDRADSYYHVLWSGLTASERLVLYQLALDGWANPKNTAAIQQLERKLLIRKAPIYRIMNESFRRFIESTEHADEIAQWEKHEQQSTWRAFRLVLTAVAIGVGVWLLYAQAELFQVGAVYIAAIATLLTAVTSLFSRSRRPAQAEPGPTQDSS